MLQETTMNQIQTVMMTSKNTFIYIHLGHLVYHYVNLLYCDIFKKILLLASSKLVLKHSNFSITLTMIYYFYLGEFKEIELECVMNGFEGNKTSQPKWTTDFEDWQIGNRGREPVIKNEYAIWKISVNISHGNVGMKVSYLITKCFY